MRWVLKLSFRFFDKMRTAVLSLACERRCMYQGSKRGADARERHPGAVAEVAAGRATGVGQLPPPQLYLAGGSYFGHF